MAPEQRFGSVPAEGNLAEAEIARAEADQKENFPDGIKECGTDALRLTLLQYQQQVITSSHQSADCWLHQQRHQSWQLCLSCKAPIASCTILQTSYTVHSFPLTNHQIAHAMAFGEEAPAIYKLLHLQVITALSYHLNFTFSTLQGRDLFVTGKGPEFGHPPRGGKSALVQQVVECSQICTAQPGCKLSAQPGFPTTARPAPEDLQVDTQQAGSCCCQHCGWLHQLPVWQHSAGNKPVAKLDVKSGD